MGPATMPIRILGHITTKPPSREMVVGVDRGEINGLFGVLEEAGRVVVRVFQVQLR